MNSGVRSGPSAAQLNLFTRFPMSILMNVVIHDLFYLTEFWIFHAVKMLFTDLVVDFVISTWVQQQMFATFSSEHNQADINILHQIGAAAVEDEEDKL